MITDGFPLASLSFIFFAVVLFFLTLEIEILLVKGKQPIFSLLMYQDGRYNDWWLLFASAYKGTDFEEAWLLC